MGGVGVQADGEVVQVMEMERWRRCESISKWVVDGAGDGGGKARHKGTLGYMEEMKVIELGGYGDGR